MKKIYSSINILMILIVISSCSKDVVFTEKENVCSEIPVDRMTDILWVGANLNVDTIYDNITKGMSYSYNSVLKLNSDFNYIIRVDQEIEIGRWDVNASKCELSLKHGNIEDKYFD